MRVRASSDTTPTVPEGILDIYTGAAAAYSLRKLRGAYSGAAVRVRRSNDNAEQDIGFDSNGNLNESALTSFVGANSGFVTTWYDQSGNARNMTQAIAASQPKIVTTGQIEKSQGKAAIYVNNGLSISANPASWLVIGNADRALISVITKRESSGEMSVWSGAHSSNQAWGVNFSASYSFVPYTYGSGDILSAPIDQNKIIVAVANRTSGTSTGYINNVLKGSKASTIATTATNGIGIGTRPDGVQSIGHYSEIIYFNFGLSSPIRSSIEQNIIYYYGIT